MTQHDILALAPFLVVAVAIVPLLATIVWWLLRWRPFRQGIAWLHGHLLPIVAGLVLVVASWVLVSRLICGRDGLEALYLVGLMLIAAGLCQHGNNLLATITKAGPFEFARQQRKILLFEEQLASIPFSLEIRKDPVTFTLELSDEDQYAYEKTSQYISLLEFHGLKPKDITESGDFHEFRDVLEIAIRIATMRGEFPRAKEWLNLLIELARSDREKQISHYMAGAAFLAWALSSSKRQECLFEKAVEHFKTTIALAPDDHQAYLLLAYAQDELGMYNLAIENNKKVLHIRPKSAPAKYNAAISFINLGDLPGAFDQLKALRSDDDDIGAVIEEAATDDELAPLRDSSSWKDKMKKLFEDLKG